MANPIKITDVFEYDAAIKMSLDALDSLAIKLNTIIKLAEDLKKTKVDVDISDQIKQAKDLAKAKQEVNDIQDEELVKIRAYKLAKQKLQKIQDLELKASLELEDTYTARAANLKLLSEKLKNLTEEEKKSTEEGKKMVAQYKQLLQEQAEYAQAQSEQIRLSKLTAKAAQSEKGSYDALSVEYSKLKIELNKMSAARRENTAEGQKMVTRSNEVYQEMKRLQEVTGKHTLSVGDYAKGTKELTADLKKLEIEYNKVQVAIKHMSKATKDNTTMGDELIQQSKKIAEEMARVEEAIAKNGQSAGEYAEQTNELIGKVGGLIGINTAAVGSLAKVDKSMFKLARNPIVLTLAGLITILAALTSAFAKTEQGIGLMDKAMGSLKGSGVALSSVFNDLMNLNFKGLLDRAGSTISMYGELSKFQRQFNVENAQSTKTIADLEKSLAFYNERVGDSAISFEELTSANENVLSLEQQIASERTKIANKNLALLSQDIKMRLQAGQDVSELRQAEADAYAEKIGFEGEYIAAVERAAKERRIINQDQLEQELDFLIDGFDTIKTIKEQQIKESKVYELQKEQYDELDELALDSFNKQIGIIKSFTNVAFDENELIKESDISVIYEKAKSLGLSEIITKRLLEIIRERKLAEQDLGETLKEITANEKEQREKNLESYTRYTEKRIDTEHELQLQLIELSDKSEEEKTVLVLEAEKERLIKLKALKDAYFNSGDGVDFVDTADEIEKITNGIALIDKEIAKVKKGKEDKSIYAMLGFTLTDEEKAGIEEAWSFIRSQISETAALQTKLAEQRLEEGNRMLDEAQTQLQIELDYKRDGLAADVEGAKKQVEIAKEQQKKLLEDRRKAQQAELALQTVEQGINLITAASKIYAQVGNPILGSILVGAMFAAFAGAKIRAAQLTRKTFRKGGFEDLNYGGTHESGNDINVGFTNKSELRAERGEGLSVWNHKAIATYGKDGLRNLTNDINNLQLKTYVEQSQGGKDAVIINMDTKELNETMKKNASKTEYISGGHRVVKFGNKTTRYAV